MIYDPVESSGLREAPRVDLTTTSWTSAFLGGFVSVLNFQVAAQQDARSNGIHELGVHIRTNFCESRSMPFGIFE